MLSSDDRLAASAESNPKCLRTDPKNAPVAAVTRYGDRLDNLTGACGDD